MSRYRDQVAAALAATTILGPSRYAWLGRASRPLARAVAAELDESRLRRYLVSCLRDELYVSFYCHGRPVEARWREPEPPSSDPWLLAAMSEANTGRGGWEPGWTVQGVEADEVLVASDRLRARAPLGDCEAGAGTIAPGAAVSLRLPNELPELSPGFYTAVGDACGPSSSASVVRVYWNVTPAGAPALVRMLASRLNAAGVPFRLKVGDHPFRLDRCDAAVLYVEGGAFRAIEGTLRDIADRLAGHLVPQVPAFTLEHARGVGLAEDDGDGESFGTRLCALLADGIVRVHEQGITDARAQIDVVAERFAETGVQIDAPYLAPSLADRHVL